jgi:RimJ/RimL family protein N-acetyltransferase
VIEATQVVTRSHDVALRVCGPADRAAIERLGHPPAVAAILCPSLPLRMLWRLSGTHALSVAAVEERTGMVLGCVQFLRSRRSPHTWMFGHWRVVPAMRRRGVGRRLIQEGSRRLPGASRLYSYVERDNDGSKEAHARLGFEAGRTLRGNASLGALSTIGPTTPALRLDPVRRRDWDVLFAIYVRAMGTLWLRLHPGIGPRNFLEGAPGGLRAISVAIARGSRETKGPAAGLVVWAGAGPVFFADPTVCDHGLLARVALQIMAKGSRRDDEIRLRGLPRSMGDRPGPIRFQELMGMPDVRTQWVD